ncbi:SCO7613 C-terminal domain-containing membrane protein [Streptomyces polyrhachis]|uniref:SCO7613 C-terminal domain-containing membrane protein n=1 Tax=Streptomyces polyrhachis TaxID=1282885 RepID=A0ABW2GBW5_9ACTN
MTTPLPPAEELRRLDAELAHLDARRAQLLQRRTCLLQVLQAAAPPAGAQRPGPHWQPWQPRPAAGDAREVSAPSAQNVLLALGGVLLAVAALAFTLVSWGSMGTGGRALVLAAVTGVAGAAPVVLLRRRLTATAEALAALALALTLVDALAVMLIAEPRDPAAYWSAAFALLAAGWAGYGLLVRKVRLPLPAAVLAAQPVLPLLALAATGAESVQGVLWALLATAAADLAAALTVTRRSVRLTAAVAAWATGGCALLGAGVLSLDAGTAPVLRAAALLGAGAALALLAARRTGQPAPAAVAGASVVVGVGGVVRTSVPEAWAAPGYLLAALPVAGAALAVRGTDWAAVRKGLAGAAAAAQVLVLCWTLPALAAAVAAPVRWLAKVWEGTPAEVGATVVPWGEGLAVPVTLAVSGAVALAAARFTAGVARTTASCAAVALLGAAALVLPSALTVSYPVALTLLCVLVLAALAGAVAGERRGGGAVATAALGLALAAAADATLLALAGQAATLAVCGALLAQAALAAALLTPSLRQTATACAAVGWAAALAVAAPAAAGLAAHQIALFVLLVPAATTLLAAVLRTSNRTLGPALEASGATAGALALTLAAGNTGWLSGALAVGGVIAAGAALRPQRRWAAYVSAALFLAAQWTRLAAWGVDTPEAYTLPASLAALAAGALRCRREPQTGSWAAYGPGLAFTLLPSLVAAWADPHWQRPLLLGLAALALTLAGARSRLQAPLLLGGAVLALDVLHELAPYVVQVAGVLPRWMPPAAVGALLLAVGATYEQRLREARRVREALGRMR